MEVEIPFRSGDRVGSYAVDTVIDTGWHGIVYLGRHTLMDRKAVLSVLTRLDCRDRWHRGAVLLSDLDHPNIVKLYDIGEERGFPYLALQYIRGESLGALMAREGAIETPVLLRMMSRIADALHHAHEKGVLHQAITPANLLIARTGEPVLVDFANAIPTGTGSPGPAKTVFGDPHFMSPEHWSDTCRPESDIWSLGAVMFAVLAGAPPYDGPHPDAIAQQVLSRDAIDRSMLEGRAPEYVVDMVDRCMRKDPAQRYRTADDLKRALEAAHEYHDLPRSGGPAMSLPVEGQTILAHVEYREAGLPGAFRQYRVGPYLGGGSFGDVFRARDELAGRDVAMKVLKHEHLASEETVARFRREATLLSRLHHPNVVRIHNYGRYGHTFLVTMELLCGKTLEDVIDESAPLEPAQALPLMTQALAGLAAIHEAGIVHRDLKPSNLALHGDRVVAFDLGIAHAQDLTALTASTAFVGSPRYAAPEQAAFQSVTGAADVYAAGVVLYEMLTKRTPHESESTIDLLLAIASEPPKPITEHRADLPADVIELVAAMLASSPEDRPTAAEARAWMSRC